MIKLYPFQSIFSQSSHVWRLIITSVIILITLMWMSPVSANNLKPVKFCVWDPVGSSGPFIAFLKETKLKAISWGVDLQLEAYTDEKVASNDFKSGVCDAVFLTNILAKDFVPFTAAFGAPGAIRSLDEIKVLSASLNKPNAQKYIRHNNYEMAGLFPIGEIYTFVRDKRNTAISSVSGKKVTILNGDVASTKFVELVGASPVHTSLATWAGQFNNGNVDVMFAPALAYNTFELYKGLGAEGGIINYNILYAVMETVVNVTKTPEGFGEKMRSHALSRFNELENTVKQATSEIPANYWVDLDETDLAEYNDMVRKVRLTLRDEGAYDKKAISILHAIRCKFSPSAKECAVKE